jgi:hypothetical protein
MDEKKRVKAMLSDLKDAQWLGEDCNAAACSAKTQRGAWIKIRALFRADIGDYEAEEIKLDDIVPAWARLATEEDRKEEGIEHNNCDWYVMYEMQSPYPVWVLRI